MPDRPRALRGRYPAGTDQGYCRHEYQGALCRQLRQHFRASAPDRKSLPPPPLRRDVFGPLEKITAAMWPGTPVIPEMATGASDGIYTMSAGLPTYGISGIAIDRDDIRAHGKDERVGIESYDKGVDFYYRYLKAVTSE